MQLSLSTGLLILTGLAYVLYPNIAEDHLHTLENVSKIACMCA